MSNSSDQLVDVTSRWVIAFEDARHSGEIYIPVERLTTHVMFWQPPEGERNPKLIMATFNAKLNNGCLVIGGDYQLAGVKNAAIGRRLCPECYKDGTKASVEERGDNQGACSICGVPADYVQTSYPPYFFYFSHSGSADGLHVVHDTTEHQIAEQLKHAMLCEDPRDVMFPSYLKKEEESWRVCCDVPAYFEPVVVDFNQTTLKGTFGNTCYDLQVRLN